MLQLRVDVLLSDLLWRSNYIGEFKDLAAARNAASVRRQDLFKSMISGDVKDYRVDIVPKN